MKRAGFQIIVSCLWLGLSLSSTASATEGRPLASVKIESDSLRNDEGNFRCLLFDSKVGFPGKVDQAYRRQSTPIAKGRAKLSFKEIPPGIYAVACIHDENLNRKLDKNFLGIPKEGFGFSRNPKIVVSAPKFSEAQFRVEETNQSFHIRMKYM